MANDLHCNGIEDMKIVIADRSLVPHRRTSLPPFRPMPRWYG